MQTKITAVLFGCLLCASGLAQPTPVGGVDGTFHFTTAPTPQSLQEAATILRTVADIRQVSIDAAQATINFRGAGDKVALARWALTQLDTPGNETALHEYPLAGGEVARVNFLTNLPTAREIQEALTVLRTVADIQKIFNYTARQAIVIRGNEADVAFAEWIVDQLNQPAPSKPDATPREYTLPTNSTSGNVARVNYLSNARTDQGVQEILTTLRTVGQIMKIFTYRGQWALVLRGSEGDIARAEWLIQNLDQPAGQPNAGTHSFSAPGADDVTRIFYMTHATPQGLQTALTAIRSGAKIQRAFSTTAPATVVVRGTADQVEAAAQIIAAGNGLARLQ
jgi:type II secretory pathway component GspD/PulD (secretin)